MRPSVTFRGGWAHLFFSVREGGRGAELYPSIVCRICRACKDYYYYPIILLGTLVEELQYLVSLLYTSTFCKPPRFVMSSAASTS